MASLSLSLSTCLIASMHLSVSVPSLLCVPTFSPSLCPVGLCLSTSCVFPVSTSPSLATSLTPCLRLCVFSLGLLSTDLCPSECLCVSPRPRTTNLPPRVPHSRSGSGWRGGVGGRCGGSCVFPAQNRLLLPWRRERGLRDAKLQAGGVRRGGHLDPKGGGRGRRRPVPGAPGGGGRQGLLDPCGERGCWAL